MPIININTNFVKGAKKIGLGPLTIFGLLRFYDRLFCNAYWSMYVDTDELYYDWTQACYGTCLANARLAHVITKPNVNKHCPSHMEWRVYFLHKMCKGNQKCFTFSTTNGE